VWLRSVLFPNSRRLSSWFSCARFAIVSSSDATFAPNAAFTPTSSLCSAAIIRPASSIDSVLPSEAGGGPFT
jgi:hypothetical protein